MHTGPAATSTQAERAVSRRLVGRDRVLAELYARHSEVRQAGGVETLVLEGPAGIGKSRTIATFADRIRREGGRVLVGHCVHLGEVVLPYAPLVEMVAQLTAECGSGRVAAWAGAAAPELARLLPVLGPSAGPRRPPQATGASSARLFQAMRGVLDGAAASRPLLLVVEDIQWADRSTLDMLSLLVPQLAGPTMLVATQRTDERPLEPRVGAFRSQVAGRSHQRVVLDPLTRAEQAQQLSDILGVPPTSAVLDAVYDRAEGNPFFAEELLALGERARVPDGVRELMLARLDSLPPQGRQVLRAASVIGRRAPYALLEAVLDISGERLDDQLRTAVEEHLLVVDGGVASVSFRHALLQEAVAASLLPGEAARLHRRIAESIESAPDIAGSGGSVAGLLARHWYAAGDLDRALVTSVEAAEAAKAGLAFSESLAHYERAMELVETVADAQRLLDVPRHWLLWSAAEVAHLAAEPVRAADLARAAIDVVPADAPHHHAYLHERLGRYLWMCGDGLASLSAYQRAVDLVPPEPTRWRAAALSGYSQILMLASRFAESEQYAREAIDVAVACEARSLEGHARCNLGVDLAELGRVEEGIRELEQALRIAEEEFEDVDDIARARVNLHTVLSVAGRFDEAVTLGHETLGVVEELGLTRRKGVWCRCDLAGTLILLGRYAEARTVLEEAERLGPSGIDRVVTDLLLGTLDGSAGLLAEARGRLDRVLANDAERLLDPQLIGPFFEALVAVRTWQGDLDAARTAADDGLSRLASVSHAEHVLPLVVAALRALGDAAALGKPRQGAGAGFVGDAEALARRAGALVEAAPSSDALARTYYAEALAEIGRIDGTGTAQAWAAVAGQWLALGPAPRAAYAFGRAAEASLRSRRRAEARAHLTDGLRIAREVGAAHLVAWLERVATSAGLRSPAEPEDSARSFGITRREQEVLELVAEGLSDREVADRLFISHRTVERHVSNLLAKLDAKRRAELVRLAHQGGLLEAPADR